MSDTPSVDDLRLVQAINEEGSIGAAARRLHIAQPSASARLGAIERRCGTALFERDTTGARITQAGTEMARQAEHILGHLGGVYAATAAAAREQPLRVGTFVSLAPALFPSVEILVDEPIVPTVSHGPDLIALVAEGELDAAVVGVASQVPLPRHVRVATLGRDSLELFRRRDVPGRVSGRRPFADRRVLVATYDSSGPEVRARLSRLGAIAEPAPTLPSALAMARRRGVLAVVPRSALAHNLADGEVLERLPFQQRITLSLVTGRDPDPRLKAGLRKLGHALHLRATTS